LRGAAVLDADAIGRYPLPAMPVSGLLALIDDIASLADNVGTMAGVAAQKGAAASRDVALLTKAAATKTSGEGRRPAPGTHQAFGAIVDAWIDSGAHCPDE
jgi:hypothetical protein